MSKIIIKIADESDKGGIGEVFNTTWLATYPNPEAGISVEDIKDLLEKQRLARQKQLQQPQVNTEEKEVVNIVAKDGDKVVGICRLYIYTDKNKMQALYVLPEYQGQGIGKMLWQEAQKYFRPGKDIYLEVVDYNKRAQEVYKKLGFELTGKSLQEERFRMRNGQIFTELEMIKKV